MALAVGSLPFNVDSGDTRATVEADSVVGPRLGALVNDPTGTPFSVEICADRGASHADGVVQGGLWRIEGRVRDDPGRTLIVTPDKATTFQVYDRVTLAGGEEADLIEWRGIQVAQDLEDRLWVRIAIIKPVASQPGGQGVQFAGWAGRESGDGFRIEFFAYPAVYMEAFAGGAGTERQKAYGQRHVVPYTFTAGRAGYSTNQSIGLLARPSQFGAAPADLEESSPSDPVPRENNQFHPMPGWPLAFAATAACNPSDATSYLKTVMLMARDVSTRGPWVKKLDWAVPQRLQDSDTHYLLWRPFHMPRLATDWALPTLTSTTSTGATIERRRTWQWRNSCAPQWIPELQTFDSPTPAFWAEAAEKYRAYYEDYKSPTRLLANTNVSNWKKSPSLIVGAIHTFGTRGNWLSNIQGNYGPLADFMGAAGNLLFHTQSMSKTNFGGAGSPWTPDDIEPVWRDEVVPYLKRKGYRVSAYNIWTGFARVSNVIQQVVNGSPQIRQEQGGTRPVWVGAIANTSQSRGEYVTAVPENPDYIGPVVDYLLWNATMSGINTTYIDTLGGDFTPLVGESVHEPWGGDHVVYYKALLISEARAALQAQVNPDHLLLTEAATEGLEDIDWGGSNGPMFAFHQTEFEPAYYKLIYDAGGTIPAEVTNVPYEAREPDPPLWQYVHNLWNPQARWGAALSLSNLATSDFVATGGFTPDEWLAFTAFPYASHFIIGCLQFTFDISTGLTEPVITDGAGSSSIAQGTTFMLFLRDTLIGSVTDDYAKPFLMDGRMKPPLTVDYSTGVTMVDNPLKPLIAVRHSGIRLTWSPFGWFTYPSPASADIDITGVATGDVPAVLHSVWEADSDGAIGIILVNWTASAASWEATVTPAAYGLAGTVTVNEKSTAGTLTPLGTSAAATFTIHDSGGSGDVDIGTFGAHSVKVLVLTT